MSNKKDFPHFAVSEIGTSRPVQCKAFEAYQESNVVSRRLPGAGTSGAGHPQAEKTLSEV
jgi:hypothetical protein